MLDENDEVNEIGNDTDRQKWHEIGGMDLDANLTSHGDKKPEGQLSRSHEAVSLH